MKLSKQEGFRDRNFNRFVSGKPCCVCGSPAEAHHYGGMRDGRGVGHKASDQKLVPLCHCHHREVERMGREKFEKKYGIQFDSINKHYHLIFGERNIAWQK